MGSGRGWRAAQDIHTKVAITNTTMTIHAKMLPTERLGRAGSLDFDCNELVKSAIRLLNAVNGV